MQTRRMQTRRGSLIEAVTNTVIGYLVAVGAQLVILPSFGLQVSAEQHVGIAACFTSVSLLRSYVLRRLFNRL